MRVGLSSIVGDGFGTGSFVFGEVVSAPSCPVYGTFYQTATGVDYPFAEGGAEVLVSENSTTYLTQTVTVDQYHDGSCGYYYDWTSETNVVYKSYGWLIVQLDAEQSVSVDINGTYYQIGTQQYNAYHDGSGGYYALSENPSYYPYGTFLTTQSGVSIQIEVPSGSMNYAVAGTCDYNYYTDGYGSYYNTQNNISYYPYGTFLYNDGSYDYYSDGSGGYYY